MRADCKSARTILIKAVLACGNLVVRWYRLSALQTLSLVCGQIANLPEPSSTARIFMMPSHSRLVHRGLQPRCTECQGLQPDKSVICLLQIHGNIASSYHRLSALQTLSLICGQIANLPEPSL